MPATESIYHNEILLRVPLGFKEFSARKLELDRCSEGEPLVICELYRVLADEFEQIGYTMMAENCRRRADQWRRKRP